VKLPKDKLLKKEDLDNTIQRCTFCDISNLSFNKYNYDKGFGKLNGWGGKSKIKYMFIGLNPSYRRFKECVDAFGGEQSCWGTGKEFVDILKELKIIDNSYVTNLVKCSTMNNKVNEDQMGNCLMYLLEEIELLKPEKIIALGKDVQTFLKNSENFSSNGIYYIYHPNYVFSYNRSLLTEYKQEIQKICTK